MKRSGILARLRRLASDEERGSILILAAIILPIIMTMVAGGVVAYTLLNGQREIQSAADRAALAAAAALPPLDPNVVLNQIGFPMQICAQGITPCTNTSAVYNIMPTEAQNLMQTNQLIPDPRAVACAYGRSALDSTSAPMVGTFANPNNTATPAGDSPTVCTQFSKTNGAQVINNGHTVPDPRINPSLLPGTVLTCIDSIANYLNSSLTSILSGPLSGYSGALSSILSAIVDPLNQIAPALLEPEVKVDISQGYNPPLLSAITGNQGVDLQATAVARRRLKNAIVVKLQPGQRVGLTATGGVNMQSALAIPQSSLYTDLSVSNNNLISLEQAMVNLGVGGMNCTNPLGDLILDLNDIYNPTTGASSAVDLVSQAVTAVQQAATRTGIPPANIQASGFLMIGVGNASNSTWSISAAVQASLEADLGKFLGDTVANVANALLGPIASLQIPILDAALVTFAAAGNSFDASCIASPSYPNCPVLVAAANAWGAFRASLVS